eukprot:189451-Rhodomonas_salina.8
MRHEVIAVQCRTDGGSIREHGCVSARVWPTLKETLRVAGWGGREPEAAERAERDAAVPDVLLARRVEAQPLHAARASVRLLRELQRVCGGMLAPGCTCRPRCCCP